MQDQVRRRAWGLSGRLIVSYIVVTLAVVVLVEALVLGLQTGPAVNETRLQAQLNTAAQNYAQRYTDGWPAGTVLPRLATVAGDGALVIPAITGPIRSDHAITAAVAIATDGTVVASSAPSRYPPGRAASSEIPVQADPTNLDTCWPRCIKGGSVWTRYGSVTFSVWRVGSGASTSAASGHYPVAYVYVQAPTPLGFVNPIRAWSELSQPGEASPLLAAPSALLVAIVPVGVLFGLLTSRGIVRRVRRLDRAAVAVADGDYAVSLP
ncbi:MAG: hypothetical protein J2P28_09565, partial [Actinobacteria bacterium]|nr:hypothetical protein [Actinomycetota bacterium]